MRRVILVLTAAVVACSGDNNNSDGPEGPQCLDVAAADFDVNSGWDSADYCDVPTDLGCYPWHESAEDTCGPFTTMRTSATTAESASACVTLLTSLNCAQFASDDGSSDLTFYIVDADRFTMRVLGAYQTRAIDTTFYFNPCHQNCLSAVTLVSLDDDQQKICDIPRQGKPACLFPEAAHSLTFVRADGGSIVMRTAGEETAMARVMDAE